jgi:hypothetical protein
MHSTIENNQIHILITWPIKRQSFENFLNNKIQNAIWNINKNNPNPKHVGSAGSVFPSKQKHLPAPRQMDLASLSSCHSLPAK